MKKELVENEHKQNKPLLYKIGIGLLILYPILWGLAVLVPFTPFPTYIKATTVTVCIVVGEIFFLIGVAFVGKEVVKKYKSKLNPRNWGRKDDRQ